MAHHALIGNQIIVRCHFKSTLRSFFEVLKVIKKGKLGKRVTSIPNRKINLTGNERDRERGQGRAKYLTPTWEYMACAAKYVVHLAESRTIVVYPFTPC